MEFLERLKNGEVLIMGQLRFAWSPVVNGVLCLNDKGEILAVDGDTSKAIEFYGRLDKISTMYKILSGEN